jgi:hypothetical protein
MGKSQRNESVSLVTLGGRVGPLVHPWPSGKLWTGTPECTLGVFQYESMAWGGTYVINADRIGRVRHGLLARGCVRRLPRISRTLGF